MAASTMISPRKVALVFLIGILLFLPVSGAARPVQAAATADLSAVESDVVPPAEGAPPGVAAIYGVPEGEAFDRPDVFRTVIVGLRWAEPLDETLVAARGGEVRRTFPFINSYSARLPETAIPSLASNALVEYIDVDVDVPTGTIAQQEVGWGVSHVHANDQHSVGNRGAGIKVAILDTGVDYGHPDLDGNFDPNNRGHDFVNEDADPMDDHSLSHGTHVAGIVGAENNDFGVLGIAPEARLYAVKVADAGGDWTEEDMVQGVEWAIQNGMQILNVSLQHPSNRAAVKRALDQAYYEYDILVVAASGNSYATEKPVQYPAKHDSVVAVGAIDTQDQRPSWSHYGPELELAAPGASIKSTTRGQNGNYENSYDVFGGTSQAAPHASGVAALIMSSPIDTHFDFDQDGAWDANEVRKRLAATAEDLGPAGRDAEYGYGLVDARRFDAANTAGGGYWQSSARAVDGRLETYAYSSWEPDWSYAEAFVRSTFVAQATVANPEFVYTLYEKGNLWALDEWSTATSYGRIKLLNYAGSTLFSYQPTLHSFEGPGQLNIDETHKLSYAWNGTLTAGQRYTIEVGLGVETWWDAEADFSPSDGGDDYARVVWSPAPYVVYSDAFDPFFDNLGSDASKANWGRAGGTWDIVVPNPPDPQLPPHAEGSGGRSEYIANAEYTRDGALEAYVSMTGGYDPFAGLVARWRYAEGQQNGPQYMAVWLHMRDGGGIIVEQWRPSGLTVYANVPVSLETGQFYKVRVELQGQHVRVLLNGQVKIDGTYGIDNVPGLTGLTVATTPGRFYNFWSSGLYGWSFPSGNWMATGGMYDQDTEDERLSQSQAGDNRRAVLDGLDLSDFIYSATVNLKVKDNWGTGLTFRTDASGYGYVLCFRTSTIELWKERGLGQGQKAVYSFSAAENTDYTLKVRATGKKFTFYRNGVLLGTWTDPYNDLSHGYVGFDAANSTHFDNVSIT